MSSQDFDVFLSYNRADAASVRDVKRRLESRGVKCWMDEEELPPGASSVDGLNHGLSHARCVAVFLGRSGFGPWQVREIKAAEHLERTVIPVLLPGADPEQLPPLMLDPTRVDFRKDITDPEVERFAKGIRPDRGTGFQPVSGGETKSRGLEAPATARSWVWRSSLESREADQISVLAIVETLLAVVGYWWIAIRFNTHWHLVSSVFIAPLLLLRSPESIETGVRWFLGNPFGFETFELWPRSKKLFWFVAVATVSGLLTFGVLSPLSFLFVDRQGWSWFGMSAVFGAAAVVVAFAVTVAVEGAGADADAGAVAVEGADADAGAGVGAVVGVVVGVGVGVGVGAAAAAVAVAVAVVVVVVVVAVAEATKRRGWAMILLSPFVPLLGIGVGIGFTVRAVAVRVLATLRFTFAGLGRLPTNWRENNLLTDSFLPAELLPGIRNENDFFSLDGLVRRCQQADNKYQWSDAAIAPFLFAPSFLYRLNIKATAWFWWPLAYLLKPMPSADEERARQQALCWPWSNPVQRALIFLSFLIGSLAPLAWTLQISLPRLTDFVARLPLPVQVLTGLSSGVAVWHGMLWGIAGTGLGMLLIAGNASSHVAHGSFSHYRQTRPHDVRLMTLLRRVRRLAVIGLLALGLGALLLHDRTWQTYVPAPEAWLRTLERFYRR